MKTEPQYQLFAIQRRPIPGLLVGDTVRFSDQREGRVTHIENGWASIIPGDKKTFDLNHLNLEYEKVQEVLAKYFKVWDGEEMHCFRPDSFTSKPNIHELTCFNGKWEMDGCDVTLLLYTNKNDLNGRLICEGDIVEVKNGPGKVRCVCKFNGTSFALINPVDQGNWTAGLRTASFLTIVGNIYENPKLL